MHRSREFAASWAYFLLIWVIAVAVAVAQSVLLLWSLDLTLIAVAMVDVSRSTCARLWACSNQLQSKENTRYLLFCSVCACVSTTKNRTPPKQFMSAYVACIYMYTNIHAYTRNSWAFVRLLQDLANVHKCIHTCMHACKHTHLMNLVEESCNCFKSC